MQTVELEKNKVEGKYKTLSKANGDAVADIEYFKSENKKLRSQLHEASTSKTSEQLQLRDSLAKVAAERDKNKEQYSALFRQLQQSMDSVQLLQTEKDRLQVCQGVAVRWKKVLYFILFQEQIREIQRLSGGGKSSSAVPEVHQVGESLENPTLYQWLRHQPSWSPDTWLSVSTRWSQKGWVEEELVEVLRPVLLEPCLRSSSPSSSSASPS